MLWWCWETEIWTNGLFLVQSVGRSMHLSKSQKIHCHRMPQMLNEESGFENDTCPISSINYDSILAMFAEDK